MLTTKIFRSGNSQAVRIPKEYRVDGDEVMIVQLGDLIILCPKGKEDALFFSSLGGFTDDFFESITQARQENNPDIPMEPL